MPRKLVSVNILWVFYIVYMCQIVSLSFPTKDIHKMLKIGISETIRFSYAIVYPLFLFLFSYLSYFDLGWKRHTSSSSLSKQAVNWKLCENYKYIRRGLLFHRCWKLSNWVSAKTLREAGVSIILQFLTLFPRNGILSENTPDMTSKLRTNKEDSDDDSSWWLNSGNPESIPEFR